MFFVEFSFETIFCLKQISKFMRFGKGSYFFIFIAKIGEVPQLKLDHLAVEWIFYMKDLDHSARQFEQSFEN